MFKTKRIRPDICIIGGIILGTGAIVMAVSDTWNNKETISEDIEAVKGYKNYDPEKEKAEHPDHPIMTLEDAKKLKSTYQKKLAVDILKAYWRTGLMTGGSIFLILSGRKLMRKQILELSAMYASLLESYRRYRQNVIDDIGAEKDQEYAYGIKTVDAIDEETGEVTKRTMIDTGRAASPYARWVNEGIWDSNERRWIWQNNIYTANRDELAVRIKLIQNECNDILRRRGFMTLNEVYYKLGLPMTEAGQHVGWVRGGFTDGTAGDDFIDFGVFPEFGNGKYQLPVNKLFLDKSTNQRCPLLDFNCICLDQIWDNMYEYDNRSLIAYDQRNRGGYDHSAEVLDRFFQNADYAEEFKESFALRGN